MKIAISVENDWSWPEDRTIYGIMIIEANNKNEIYIKEKEIKTLCKETEENLNYSYRNREKQSVKEEIMKEFIKNMNNIGEFYGNKDILIMYEKHFPEI